MPIPLTLATSTGWSISIGTAKCLRHQISPTQGLLAAVVERVVVAVRQVALAAVPAAVPGRVAAPAETMVGTAVVGQVAVTAEATMGVALAQRESRAGEVAAAWLKFAESMKSLAFGILKRPPNWVIRLIFIPAFKLSPTRISPSTDLAGPLLL